MWWRQKTGTTESGARHGESKASVAPGIRLDAGGEGPKLEKLEQVVAGADQ